MIGQIVGGIVRAVMAAYGGRLVEQGMLTDGQLTQGIGAVLVLVTIGWSAWQKSKGRTVPGGEFNPKAEVRRATIAGGTPAPRGRRAGRPRSGEEGRADFDALMIAGIVFLMLGIGLYAVPAPVVGREVPDLVGGRPVSEWLQVVKVEDRRPFLVRLVASFRCTPGVAVVHGTDRTNGTYGLAVTKVELTGGAEF